MPLSARDLAGCLLEAGAVRLQPLDPFTRAGGLTSPTKQRLEKRATDQRERTFEPPMNTDEHRLKADQETKPSDKKIFVLFLFSSVFIGVHRWLKIPFNRLHPNASVDAFLGARDAFVCA
jgi:hypothetical protein